MGGWDEGQVFVMAGGTGSRLQPLTRARCKPALPFGARHRVIDFVLSSLRNAGLGPIDVLLQYQPQELIRHLGQTWPESEAPPVRLRPSLPGRSYRGTADAVRQNLHSARASGARWIAVFGADHVYRMDVRAMVEQHLAQGADVSVAVLPVPRASASEFGIVDIDAQQRVCAFREKPAFADESAAHPGQALASMGNYVFSTEVLGETLDRAPEATDFGQHLLPALLQSHRVMAYDFERSPSPGHHAETDGARRRYWRDIGTLDAYFDAQMDTLGPNPAFSLDDGGWPIGSAPLSKALPLVGRHAEVADSSLGARSHIEGAMLDHVIAGEDVIVARQAQIDHAVLMAGTQVGAGARLRRVIVDEGNHVPADEVIGFDAVRDRARFPVSACGIVVVPRGHFTRAAAPAWVPVGPRPAPTLTARA